MFDGSSRSRIAPAHVATKSRGPLLMSGPGDARLDTTPAYQRLFGYATVVAGGECEN